MDKDSLNCWVLDLANLLDIGGNAVAYNGTLLFDSMQDAGAISLRHTAFGTSPIKLRLDILLLCVEGKIDYVMDCSRPVTLKSGEIAFFQQGQMVELRETGSDIRLLMIAFPHDKVAEIRQLDNIGATYDTVVFRPASSYITRLLSHYDGLRECIEQADILYKEKMVNAYLDLILLLLSNICQSYAATGITDSGSKGIPRNLRYYHQFIKLAKEHFKSHREVEFYADRMCLSAGHLSRIVKETSGRTVSEWVREYVILEAKAMLRSSDLAIYQISDALNFPNASFFSKYFRAMTGMTPGEFRRK